MKYLKKTQPFLVEELRFRLKIESCNIKVRKRMLYSDIFNTIYFQHKHLDISQVGNGSISSSAGFSIMVIWDKRSVFAFDSEHQLDEGCHVPNGQSVHVYLKSLQFLNSFLIRYFWNTADTRCRQYDMQFFKIKVSIADIEKILKSMRYVII